jgi:two-component system response regulator (stage 0 sporulation protein F)
MEEFLGVILKKSILIVEDDQRTLEGLGRLLEKEGYQIYRAATGYEGIQQVKKEHIDLVLLDLKMPGGLSGIDDLRIFRNLRPHLPVVILTAYVSEINIEDAKKYGVKNILSKPIDIKLLKSLINDVLNNGDNCLSKSISERCG